MMIFACATDRTGPLVLLLVQEALLHCTCRYDHAVLKPQDDINPGELMTMSQS